jgi:hypothetical protein
MTEQQIVQRVAQAMRASKAWPVVSAAGSAVTLAQAAVAALGLQAGGSHELVPRRGLDLEQHMRLMDGEQE